MVVKKALIVLKEGSPFAAYKYTSFYDPTNTVKSRLPKLPNSRERYHFSACKLGNDTKVILSGGQDKNGKWSA